MTHLILMALGLTAPHHHATPIKATWQECRSDVGCRWYPLKRATHRPLGHWHACTTSPAITICTTYPTWTRHSPRKPQPQATVRVVRPQVTTMPAGTTYRYRTTGYGPGCGASGATASGIWPYPGIAAATLPFNTRGYVPGYGPFVVEDTGVGPGQLDLYFPSCGQAIFWGVRYLSVTVY